METGGRDHVVKGVRQKGDGFHQNLLVRAKSTREEGLNLATGSL
jgi:hypothetical protein